MRNSAYFWLELVPQNRKQGGELVDRRSFFGTLGPASVALGLSGSTSAANLSGTGHEGPVSSGKSLLGQQFKRTALETANGVIPRDLSYAPGDLRRYGAVGNAAQDNATAFTHAFSSGHRVFGAAEDIYCISSSVTLPDTLEFDGNGCTIVLSGSAQLIRNAPVADVSTTIESGATQGSVSVDVASASGFSVGQFVLVYAPRFPSLWIRIKEISGTRITLDRPLPFDYSGTIHFHGYVDGTLGPKCHIRNVIFDGSKNTGVSASSGQIARLGGYADVFLENVQARNYAIKSIAVLVQVYICIDTRITGCRFHNNELRASGNLVDIQDCAQVIFSENITRGSGFCVNITRSSLAQVVNNSIAGRKTWERTQSVYFSTRGIKMVACGTALVVGNSIDDFESPIKIHNGFRATVQGNSIRNADYHSSNTMGQALSISSSKHADAFGASIIGNIIESVGGLGIGVDNGASKGRGRTIVSGNYLRNINTVGIYANAPNCIISDNIIDEWGVATRSDGIHYAEGATVTGNRFHNSDQNRICLRTYLEPGSLYVFENNVAVDGNPLFASSGAIESAGTATISAGNTSVTITHNLLGTAEAHEFTLVPTADSRNSPGLVWVDEITATRAKINCENDPAAPGLDIAWRAKKAMPFTA
jgi:hypothetical protein